MFNFGGSERTRSEVAKSILSEKKLNWDDISTYKKYLQIDATVLVSCWDGIGRSTDMSKDLDLDHITALKIESGLSGLVNRDWETEILPILDAMCDYKFVVFTLHHLGELNKSAAVINYLRAKMGDRFIIEENSVRVIENIRQY